jgi:hypothetical protein
MWETDMRNIGAFAPNGALPRPTQAGTTAVALNATGRPARRLLLAIVVRLVAAHRRQQAAAVDRALRYGLAAID